MTLLQLDFLELVELILYIFYIYFVIVLAILFQPNKYTYAMLFFSVYFITWNIIHPTNCSNLTVIVRVFLVSLYTLCCAAVYKLIHYIYWEKSNYTFLFLLGPFVYFMLVKLSLYTFKCNKYSNITFGFNILNLFAASKLK